jgi:pimeloyl-ACP methyl ester carboxylesterase
MTGPSRGSVALLALLLAACAPGVTPASPSGGTAPASASALASPSALGPSASPTLPYAEVEFRAEGGPTLRGRVWSEGHIGVVLAHGFSTSTGQSDWNAFAAHLAGLGYGVLTFDFRGFCDVAPFGDRDGCSEGSIQLGENWRDAEAAVEYLRSHGSERILLVGASMGGLAAFRAADEAALDLAGIVSLATPQYPSTYYDGEPPENDVTPERLQRIAAAKLFIAGANDVQVPGEAPLRPGVVSVSFADDARAMFEASPEPRQLEIVDSDKHSSELLFDASPSSTTDAAAAHRAVVEHTRALIVAFVKEHA